MTRWWEICTFKKKEEDERHNNRYNNRSYGLRDYLASNRRDILSKSDKIKCIKATFRDFLKENELEMRWSDNLELVLQSKDKSFEDEDYVYIPMCDLRTRR